jgi:hypothetical protein
MEPKEKAEQLVNKMFNWIEGGSVIEYESARECALIAVDEILNMGIMAQSGEWNMAKEYWQEVKQEIENL